MSAQKAPKQRTLPAYPGEPRYARADNVARCRQCQREAATAARIPHTKRCQRATAKIAALWKEPL